MASITEATEKFVAILNALHGDDRTEFSAMAGRTYDRVVIRNYGSPSVHAFVGRADGAVYKPAGWVAPAKGVRYASIDAAARMSDRNGSYLYR